MSEGTTDLRVGGWMLSKIVQTAQEELSALRNEKLADSTSASVEELRIAQAVLLLVLRALDTGDERLWRELDNTLRRIASSSGASPSSGATPPDAPLPQSAPRRGNLEPLAGLAQTAPANTSRRERALPFAVPVVASSPDPSLPAAEVVVTAAGANLSLRQHAEMCAAHARAPAEWNSVLARYGFTRHEVFSALDRLWRERLASDPALERVWREVYRLALQSP